MKICIASDIHGSAYYCEKLICNLQKENPQYLLLLGDLLYHGPRNPLPRDYDTQKVATLLNSASNFTKIIWVKGNCDATVDQVMLNFQMSQNATIIVDDVTFFATHGDAYSLSNPPKLGKGDILLNGHFHVPCAQKFGNDNLYVNCGSVSIPKENSSHCYLVFEKGVFTWKDLDGNLLDSYKI